MGAALERAKSVGRTPSLSFDHVAQPPFPVVRGAVFVEAPPVALVLTGAKALPPAWSCFAWPREDEQLSARVASIGRSRVRRRRSMTGQAGGRG